MTQFLLAAGAVMIMGLALLTRPLWAGRGTQGTAAKRFQAQLAGLSNDLAKGKITDEQFKQQQAELTQALTESLSGETTAAPPPNKPATVALLLGVPVLAGLLYLQIGKPVAIDGVEPAAQTTEQSMDMNQAIDSLRSRLEQAPGDAEGWALLGRSYMAIQNYPEANAAFERAATLDSANPMIQVGLAESLIYVSGQATVPARSKQLLQTAIQTDPNNQKALWLLGLGAYQSAQWTVAIGHWDKLMTMLDPAAGSAQQIQGMLAEARQKAGVSEAPRTSAMPAQPDTAAGAPSLAVNVSLDPALASKVTGAEVLFVFARAPTGPPMPLAIQRLSARDLPLSIQLNDSHAMVPNMNLSSRSEVVVGARISRTGNASPSPGDLQVFTGALANTTSEPINLIISEIVQ